MTTTLQPIEPHCVRKLEFGGFKIMALITRSWVVFYAEVPHRKRYELMDPQGLVHKILFRRFYTEISRTIEDLQVYGVDHEGALPVGARLYLPVGKAA